MHLSEVTARTGGVCRCDGMHGLRLAGLECLVSHR